MDLFFKRREHLRTKRAAAESEEDKHERLQRKQTYDGIGSQVMPARRSRTKVYYWEDVGFPAGHRLRLPLTRAQVEDYWKNRDGQRRYDEFFDEWDICSAFGGDDARMESDDEMEEREVRALLGIGLDGFPNDDMEVDEDDVYNGGSPIQQHSDMSARDSASLQYKTQLSNDVALRTLVSSIQPPVPDKPPLKFDTLADTVKYRYGAHLDNAADTQGVGLAIPKVLVMVALRGIENTDNLHDAAKQEHEAALLTLQRLIARILACGLPEPSSADLTLLRPPNAKVSIEVKSYHPKVVDLFGVLRGTCYITHSPDPSDVNWQLAIDDPATAAEILRRGWGPNLTAIVRALLTRSIPFHTYRHRPADALSGIHHIHRNYRDRGLGYHFGVRRGTVADFEAYVYSGEGPVPPRGACVPRGVAVWGDCVAVGSGGTWGGVCGERGGDGSE